MLSRRPNMKRFLVVFLCLIALFCVQLTRPTSSVTGSSHALSVSAASGMAAITVSPGSISSPRTLTGQDLEQQMAALKEKLERPGSDPKLWDQYEALIAQMNELSNQTHKHDTDGGFVPQVSSCINGALSAGSATFNRPNTTTTGSGVPGPCTLSTSTAAHYDVYQFNLTGCTTFPTEVTISLCGGSIAGSGCATSSFDSVLYLYRTGGLTNNGSTRPAFSPTSPCTNLQAANDDLTAGTTSAGGSSCNGATCHPLCTGTTSRSGLIRSLGSGFFEVVVAGFGNATTGSYSLYVNAPGAGCKIGRAHV